MVQNKNSIPVLHKYKSNSEKQQLKKNTGIMKTQHLWEIFKLYVHITNEILVVANMYCVLYVPVIVLSNFYVLSHLAVCLMKKSV